MNVATAFLRGFLGDHPLAKKFLIVPSYQAGRQIGEALTAGGASWVNLHYLTLPALAQEVAGPELSGRGVRLLSAREALFLVEGIYRELRSEGRLEYFGRVEASAGIVRALRSSLTALRLAGLKADGIAPADFVSEEKGKEIGLMLGRYEKALESRKLLDLPGLYDIAAGQVETSPAAGITAPGQAPPQERGRKYYLLLCNRPLDYLARRFLERIAGERLVCVPEDPVHGLVRPRRLPEVGGPKAVDHPGGNRGAAPLAPAEAKPGHLGSGWEAAGPSAASSNAERLPWLFAPQSAPPPLPDDTLSIQAAVGPTNELRSILRRVVAEKLPFDDVEIIHPQGSLHPSILYSLAAKNGLPVTYAGGVPLAFTAPGKVFAGLVDWLEHDYLATDLCALIEAGVILLPVSPLRASRYLKSAMIGWGRERYAARLKSLIESLEQAAEEAAVSEDEDPAATARRARSIEELDRLIAFISELLASLPAGARTPAENRAAAGPGEEEAKVEGQPAASRPGVAAVSAAPIDFAALCRGLAAIIGKFSALHGVHDAEARDMLLVRLDEATTFETGPLDRRTVFDWLRAVGEGLFVGASGPAPGHLHAASSRSGGFSGRPLTFVVGLDQGAYPGAGVEDPILLDEERERLSPELETSADALRAALWEIASLLARLRGRVALSYSSYDIIEERPSFPSSLILQAVRLREGNPALDYSALAGLIPEALGFLPPEGRDGAAFDEIDWWLRKLAPSGLLRDGLEAVKEHFVSLGRGIFASERRGKPIVSAYEGRVKLAPAEADPLVNDDIVMSASRLEQLAKCPFGYFLQYVLDVREPEELELDTSRWLDPRLRGSLLHDVYAAFLKELTSRAGADPAPGRVGVDPEKHAPLIRRIGEEIIARYRDEIPPPTQGIFERERREIMAELDVFLMAEARRETPVEPLLFEVGFGKRRPARGAARGERGEGVDDLVRVSCGPGGGIRLTGRIDRIDRLGPGRYRVVDYKTGGYKPYEALKRFGRGEFLQPALYAIAAEEILKRLGVDADPAVVESGYSFPTRRGEGKEVMVRDVDRQALGRLLVELTALLREGRFVVNPAASCGYCAYEPVCAAVSAVGRAKEKKATDPESFAIFDRLKDYE